MTAAAAGVVAFAGGCGWPAVPTTVKAITAKSAAGTATCAPTVLTPEVRDDQGTAGTQRFTVVLTNRGSATCSIVGYPVLVLRDSDGRVLPPANPTGVSQPVRLPAGRSATASMTVTPAACDTVPLASSAAVSPPGSSHATTLPVSIPVCQPTISPVVG